MEVMSFDLLEGGGVIKIQVGIKETIWPLYSRINKKYMYKHVHAYMNLYFHLATCRERLTLVS